MSVLIKSGNLADLSAVRPIGATAPAAVSKAEEERRMLKRRIAALENDVGDRDAAIDELHLAVERAHLEGQERGRAAGLAEAEDRQAERLELLEKGIGETQAELSSALRSFERLSLVVARECLDTILGSSDDRAALVAAAVRTQIGKIDKAMLLGIKLSRHDFPDDEALFALAERIGLPRTALTTDSEMASGGCVMTLRLGAMEIGINQQWGKLREALSRLSLPEERP